MITGTPPFTFEPNPGIGGGWRIRDAQDNRVATCFVEDNARAVCFALNALNGPVEWSCGHTARANCADCHAQLIRRATIFVDIIDKLLDHMDSQDAMAVAQRQRLTAALNGPISNATSNDTGEDTNERK